MTRTQAKADKIVTAWASLAPSAVFGGYTLAAFAQLAANAAGRSTTRAALREARSANIAQRVLADSASEAAIQSVVWSVLGNPDFGPASALYVAMGYQQSKARNDLLNYGREVGEGWTPVSLVPRLWIDIARPGAVSGGVVKDRSIYGHHFTAYQTGGIETMGSLPAIAMPQGAWLENVSFEINPPFTIAFVGRHYTTTGIRHYYSSGTRSSPVLVTLRHDSGNFTFQALTRGFDEGDGHLEQFASPANGAKVGTIPFVTILTSNFASSSLRYNGGRVIATGGLGAEWFRGCIIGRRWLSGDPLGFNGVFGEMLVLQGALPLAGIQKLEGYLAWKWLLAETLPPSHPYSSAKPQK